MNLRGRARRMVVLALTAVLLGGCAGTAGALRPLSAPVPDVAVSMFKALAVETTTRGDVAIAPTDRERIVNLVLRRFRERAPNRFQLLTPGASDPQMLRVSIAFTRYDEGIAFARAMLAGLGQIHIDAEVKIEAPTRDLTLGIYEVTKTFAWGGLYGGMTRITDVEVGFADAVVDLLLGDAPRS